MILRLRNHGTIFLESMALSTVVVVAIAAIMYHFSGKVRKVYTDPYGIKIDYGTMRDDAELVIVGKIIRIYDRSSQWAKGEQHWNVKGYYDIAVESVEKGSYSDDTISVAMGWGSDTAAPQVWPPYVKKKYYTDERVKIYVNYSPEIGYYTPGLWLTIEPASFSKLIH